MSLILSLFLGYGYMCMSRIKRSPTVGETKDLGNELAMSSQEEQKPNVCGFQKPRPGG